MQEPRGLEVARVHGRFPNESTRATSECSVSRDVCIKPGHKTDNFEIFRISRSGRVCACIVMSPWLSGIVAGLQQQPQPYVNYVNVLGPVPISSAWPIWRCGLNRCTNGGATMSSQVHFSSSSSFAQNHTHTHTQMETKRHE